LVIGDAGSGDPNQHHHPSSERPDGDIPNLGVIKAIILEGERRAGEDRLPIFEIEALLPQGPFPLPRIKGDPYRPR
jgi:hypothetical protein